MIAMSSEDGHGVQSTFYWVVDPQLKVMKRGAPSQSIHRRRFVEVTRDLIDRNDGECQVGVVVGNARESLRRQTGLAGGISTRQCC